jgi:hypothetical protein
MSRDGEPQDPWFEKFKAQRDAMDKKLTDSYRQLDDHRLAMYKRIASINAKLNSRFDDFNAGKGIDNRARQLSTPEAH